MQLKSKPLIIGIVAAVILLIVGAIYFFVIKNDDSEVTTDPDTQDNSQEEGNTDTDTDTDTDADTDADTDTDTDTDAGTDTNMDMDASTEDDGEAVLEALGFDCQTTTIAASAEAGAAQTAAADPSLLAFNQQYASLIDESGAASNEILNCNHAEEQLNVIVASITDANLHLETLVEATCIVSTNEGVTGEDLEPYLQGIKSDLEAELPLVIGSKVYLANGDPEVRKQFKALIETADVEYTPHVLPELACNA